eukprot:gene1678-biopygen2514
MPIAQCRVTATGRGEGGAGVRPIFDHLEFHASELCIRCYRLVVSGAPVGCARNDVADGGLPQKEEEHWGVQCRAPVSSRPRRTVLCTAAPHCALQRRAELRYASLRCTALRSATLHRRSATRRAAAPRRTVCPR